MLVGEIYKWTTNKAKGHGTRDKYHIFICEHGVYQNIFLFVNTANYHQDYLITQLEYPCFTKPESFIGCEDVVCYENQEISHLSPTDCLGQLTPDFMAKLSAHLANSETMEGKLINIVCGALNNP